MQLQVSITKEEAEKLRILAKKEALSRSVYIGLMLKAKIKRDFKNEN